MNAYGELIDGDTLRFERLLPGPIERVWAYLVEPEKRATWLAGGIVDGREGGAIELVFHNERLGRAGAEAPEKYRGYEGVRMSGEVLVFDPPRCFVHTWEGSEVRFDLSETGDGQVRLVLTHTRLIEPREHAGVLAGWHTHLEILSNRLAGNEPDSFWNLHQPLEAHYRGRVASPQ